MEVYGTDTPALNTTTRSPRSSLRRGAAVDRAIAVETMPHGGNLHGFTAEYQNSDIDPASLPSGAGDSACSSRCTCQSYTVTPPVEDTEPRTGEVTRPSFERRSRAVYCPVHGVNEDFKASFAEHAAWVCRRTDYRRCDVWHVTAKLHPADVVRLGLSSDDSRPVLSQLLPRLRQRLRVRRDENAEVLLSMSPRPSDGMWHLHILVLSKKCDNEDLMDTFRLSGVDVEITTPRSRQKERDEAPMSAERFAACIGGYLFKNRVQGAMQGADTSFSSWGEGVGYYSEAAVTRRREYAQMMAEAGGDSAPAHCTNTQFRTQPDEAGENGGDTDGTSDTDNAENDGPMPVVVGEDVVQSEAAYRRVVIQALMDRLHTDVGVVGLGRCKLTWVEVDDGITCLVRPLELHDDEQRAVPWRIVDAAETPVIRSSTESDQCPTMDTDHDAEDDTTDDTDTSDTDTQTPDVADEFLQSARHGRVVMVLPDGRHVQETVDGEVVRDEKVPL